MGGDRVGGIVVDVDDDDDDDVRVAFAAGCCLMPFVSDLDVPQTYEDELSHS